MPTERRAAHAALAFTLALALAACDDAPPEGPLALRVTPAPVPEAAPGARLIPLGGLELRARLGPFGGLSALEVSQDGARLLALSDRGLRLDADIVRAGPDATLAGLAAPRIAQLPGPDGVPPPLFARDAEGLAALAPDLSGPFAVSFERRHRVATFAGPDAPERPLVDLAPFFAPLAGNAGAEALALAPDGRLLALVEGGRLDGAGHGAFWITPDGAVTTTDVPGTGALAPVGADFGPDGRLYLLTRDFQPLGGFTFAVARYTVEGDALIGPEPLATFPAQPAGDNAEGLAVWRDAAGRLRLLIVTDDNLSLMQRTFLWEFAVAEPAP